MLNILINATIGFIVAGTIASLMVSLRAFLPAWRQLSGEVKASKAGVAVRVSVRDVAVPGETAQIITLPVAPARQGALRAAA